jgi:hypothetical protein
MNNPKKLGRYFAGLWQLHDARDFDKLEATALNILNELNYSKSTRKSIAKHIRKAYQLHGEIDDKVFSVKKDKSSKLILKYKTQICSEMDKAFNQAGLKNHKKLSYFHGSWWIDFSFTHISKNPIWYFRIIWHLFMLQINETKDLLASLKLTYIFCLAGIKGHNARNDQKMILNLTYIWEIYLRTNPKAFIF